MIFQHLHRVSSRPQSLGWIQLHHVIYQILGLGAHWVLNVALEGAAWPVYV